MRILNRARIIVLAVGMAVLCLGAWAQEPPATPPAPEAAASTPAPDPAPAEPVAPAMTESATAASDAATASAAPGSPVAVDPVTGAAGAGPSANPAETLTLMTMIKQGGFILWVIMGLGFIAVVMTIYFLLTITPKREVPQNFVKRALSQIRAGDLRGAYQMCEGRDELLVNVIRAGLKMSGHDRYVIQDAMESEGERGATALWQKISWLNNIAQIEPLLGLLGTVWGMIQAFSVIALDNSQVKSLVMAYNVSMAMITTAGGLIFAIPILLVYFYLRGRVIKIVSAVEGHASEVIELLTRGQES